MITLPLSASSAFRKRAAFATLAGIGLVGALAGCSAASPSGSTASTGSTAGGSSSSGSSGSSSGAATSSVDYKDGSYKENGTYASPGGQELINVALTLKSNVVTAVTVKTVKADPTATGYEAMFIKGIGAVAVGKNINSLTVSRVAGSSLTSMGFNDALTKIKADAKS